MKIRNVRSNGDSVFFTFEGTNWMYAVTKDKLVDLLSSEMDEFQLQCKMHDDVIAKGWKIGELETPDYVARGMVEATDGYFSGTLLLSASERTMK